MAMRYFIDAVTKHYADFAGRARRKEYWMYALFSLIVGIVVMAADLVLGTTLGDAGIFGVFYLLFAVGLFIPGLAIVVRRLHDVGKSGWFMLIAAIPLVGAIWMLVLMCRDGEPGANAYGPNPKQAIDAIG
jgi:uncharacterized membrane protein YhaH (DUF805 family)